MLEVFNQFILLGINADNRKPRFKMFGKVLSEGLLAVVSIDFHLRKFAFWGNKTNSISVSINKLTDAFLVLGMADKALLQATDNS